MLAATSILGLEPERSQVWNQNDGFKSMCSMLGYLDPPAAVTKVATSVAGVSAEFLDPRRPSSPSC